MSDRIGRKPVLIALCLGSAALPITMFSLMAGSVIGAAGAVILALLAGAVSAVGAVATAEQFPGEGRITGLALGATMATAIFGGLTPLAAQMAGRADRLVDRAGHHDRGRGACVLPVMLTLRETAPNARPSPSASS